MEKWHISEFIYLSEREDTRLFAPQISDEMKVNQELEWYQFFDTKSSHNKGCKHCIVLVLCTQVEMSS